MAYEVFAEDKWGDELHIDFDIVEGGFEGKQYVSFLINGVGDNVLLNIDQAEDLLVQLERFIVEAKVQEIVDKRGH